MTGPDPRAVEVIAPNLSTRLSGVTATVARLVPIQARAIAIAAMGPNLPPDVPRLSYGQVAALSRSGPSGARVWHARRNDEMVAGLALRARGVRLRLVFTSASQRHHTRFTKALIARMDAVVATSARTAAYLDRPARVIPHGIDADRFAPAADRAGLRARLGLPRDAMLVGCYGRIRERKGTRAFVEAMLPLLPDRPDLHAVVMGRAVGDDARFLKGLRAAVAAAGLGDRVSFRDEVPVWEMPDWYRALDLHVAPQLWEGFGLTPLEAMACGVPVVATRVGAFEEIVEPGRTGDLVAPGDVAALTGAVGRLLDDRAGRRAMGAAARAAVEARFRIEDEAGALVALYRELLATDRKSG